MMNWKDAATNYATFAIIAGLTILAVGIVFMTKDAVAQFDLPWQTTIVVAGVLLVIVGLVVNTLYESE